MFQGCESDAAADLDCLKTYVYTILFRQYITAGKLRWAGEENVSRPADGDKITAEPDENERWDTAWNGGAGDCFQPEP